LQRPTDDQFLITSGELKDRMIVLMAGRAAEEVQFGDISTGAADDLAKATDIARQFVTRFGMSDKLGQAVLEEQKFQYLGEMQGDFRSKDYSEATAREIDLAVREMVEEAYGKAKEMLSLQMTDLTAGAKLLLERETLTPDDFAPLKRKPEASAAAE
jgi:cell division protease FtsH